ncbi:hypothetical protein M1146_06320 [Patescibacteria group bacterium]|nr:hypothetical protein [Patescibacteria group bacterium]
MKANFAAFLLCTADTLDDTQKTKKKKAAAPKKKFYQDSDSSSDSDQNEGAKMGRYDEGLDLLGM